MRLFIHLGGSVGEAAERDFDLGGVLCHTGPLPLFAEGIISWHGKQLWIG